MAKKLRIVSAQLNLTVGDIEGNLKKHIETANIARDQYKADIIVFPELSITGYSPEDLLLRKDFITAANEALITIKNEVKNIHCLVGHPHQNTTGLYNSCSLIYNGTILGRYAKQFLPNYSVFDEERYFTPGNLPCVININGIPIGIMICEDLWHPAPVHQATIQGARIILAPNASPFEMDKHERRVSTLVKRVKTANAPIVYVNCVGGQDDLVFDGDSMVIDANGKISTHAGFCKENLLITDFDISSTETKIDSQDIIIPPIEKITYDCIVMGVRDYFAKNKFKSALIGISGGIDSALVAAIAVDALGAENVKGVLLPSRYTSGISIEDGKKLLENLNVESELISIEPTFKSILESLNPVFKDKKTDSTEENIQARCRCILLMALSNKFHHILLNTGNRSELAVGYTTLYGDLAGGFSPLKDVPKMLVYGLAKYRNTINHVIPNRIIERAPSAELAPNQTDQDTLPPYPVLDKILELYLNLEHSLDEIVEQGFDRELVQKIIKMIKHAEYKRRQSPIGVRINHRAFGKDRRHPITSGFKG